MPETMGMMTCVEAPLGRRRGRCLGLLPGVFHPLDGRGTDLHLRDVLEFPGQAFRAKPGFASMRRRASCFTCRVRRRAGRQGAGRLGRRGSA